MYSFRLSNCHATKIKMQTWTIRGYVRASKCGATMAWCIRHWNYLIIYMTIEVTGLGNGVDWRRNILGFLMEGKKKRRKEKRGRRRGEKRRVGYERWWNVGERWFFSFEELDEHDGFDVKEFYYSTICEWEILFVLVSEINF